MDAIELKKKWKEGKPSPGLWLRIADPAVVDLIADFGFDWVMFDAEHVAYDFQPLQMLLIALKGSGTVPLVRVPSNDLVFIKRTLDIGAAGVLVPQIGTIAEVQAAVAACKYPPMGVRGAGPRRPSRYGRFEKEYISTANDQTIVMAMIETVSAVQCIEGIVTVSGLDGIILGPVDLANSMGLYGRFEQPEVQAAISHVIAEARAARMPFGDGRPADDPADWLNRGAQIIAVGDDEAFIRRSATAALAGFHDALARGAQADRAGAREKMTR
jgi:4-hydroxy-2-oxoheptanedioate aldolase